jgi:hypothetical protein
MAWLWWWGWWLRVGKEVFGNISCVPLTGFTIKGEKHVFPLFQK